MSNPWNLTAREIDVLNELVKHGNNKMAASNLGISIKSVESFLANARIRMRLANRIMVVLTWARHCETGSSAPVGRTTLQDRVMACVEEVGDVCIEDLAPILPDVQKNSIRRALQLLEVANRLHVSGRTFRISHGKRYGFNLYSLGAAPVRVDPPKPLVQALQPPPVFYPRAVSSVWEYGATA